MRNKREKSCRIPFYQKLPGGAKNYSKIFSSKIGFWAEKSPAHEAGVINVQL
jgi:hypothetical protein